MANSILRSLVIALLTGALVFSASDGWSVVLGSLAGDQGIAQVGGAAGEPPDEAVEILSDASGAGHGSHSSDSSRQIERALEAECDADDDVEEGAAPDLRRFQVRRLAVRIGAAHASGSEALFYARHARAPPHA